MQSKWYKSKAIAVKLRQRGISVRKIEARLGIPRSTLSYWFRDVKLLPHLTLKLRQDWELALVKARKKAVLWHNAEKAKRIELARHEASAALNRIDTADPHILELALAILYLGEGSKKTQETALGSSDPLILQFFLAALKKIYYLDTKQIRYDLALRADQNREEMKRYWMRTLHLPKSSIRQINKDQRTRGSKTYPHYKGVCLIRCGNVAIQRRLLFLAQLFCQKVVAVGS